ncbi:MAG: hypothetical protein E7414_04140 [Ruminococcaceae bacterium]|nr:hypothetical protein [Oscillospiraceae bacterium]
MVKRVTFSATSLALTIICIYAASILPTGRVAALALSSVFATICVYQYGVRYGATVYVGASILSLLFIPNRMFTLIYILFVGYYPIVKLFIEKLDRLWVEWVLKVVFFNLVLVILYILFKLFFVPTFNSAIIALALQYMSVIILALEIIFVIYDWMLSYMISYYDKFLRRVSHE